MLVMERWNRRDLQTEALPKISSTFLNNLIAINNTNSHNKGAKIWIGSSIRRSHRTTSESHLQINTSPNHHLWNSIQNTHQARRHTYYNLISSSKVKQSQTRIKNSSLDTVNTSTYNILYVVTWPLHGVVN